MVPYLLFTKLLNYSKVLERRIDFELHFCHFQLNAVSILSQPYSLPNVTNVIHYCIILAKSTMLHSSGRWRECWEA